VRRRCGRRRCPRTCLRDRAARPEPASRQRANLATNVREIRPGPRACEPKSAIGAIRATPPDLRRSARPPGQEFFTLPTAGPISPSTKQRPARPSALTARPGREQRIPDPAPAAKHPGQPRDETSGGGFGLHGLSHSTSNPERKGGPSVQATFQFGGVGQPVSGRLDPKRRGLGRRGGAGGVGGAGGCRVASGFRAVRGRRPAFLPRFWLVGWVRLLSVGGIRSGEYSASGTGSSARNGRGFGGFPVSGRGSGRLIRVP